MKSPMVVFGAGGMLGCELVRRLSERFDESQLLASAKADVDITDHDAVVARKLAHVMCGGNLTGIQAVTEQYLLDLEREAFLSLCGEKKTQERIAHTLKTGKPLRN